MLNITIHKLHCFFCLWICFWINIFPQIVNGIVYIVWDETFSICSGQTSQMDTGIGVIFQRTKPCSQFYCSGENTYRQYYQQKALEVLSNNSLLHYCCKPCVWCDDWPGLMGWLFFCCTPHKKIVSENVILKHSTLMWLTCNKQVWCLILTTHVPLLCAAFWLRLICSSSSQGMLVREPGLQLAGL